MDPIACLLNRTDRTQALADMREWARKGGWLPTWDHFPPDSVSRRTFRRWCMLGICNSH